MDLFGLFIFIILMAIFSGAKNKGKQGTAQNWFSGGLGGKEKQSPVMVVPPALTAFGLNNKELDKIVSVYGTGAMLGTDEVSVLLHVDDPTAQNYLDQLVSSGRASRMLSTGGNPKYKLS